MKNNDLIIRKFLNIVKEKGITYGSVESFTGGLFASTITSIPGVSSNYIGSVVSYNSRIKVDIIGVNKETIDRYTVVSKEVAEEMALGGKMKLNVDLCVSFTGNAGPSVCEGDKSVGLFYIGIAYKNNLTSYEFHLNKERNALREEAIYLALEKIIEIIY